MLRLIVVYHRSEGTTFDADYWLNKHMPMVGAKWPLVKRWEADLGGPDQPHYAIAHILFASPEDFGAAVTSPAARDLMDDIVNYTNVQPQAYISQVAATS